MIDQAFMGRLLMPDFPKPRSGKVRDVYDLGEYLLIVATDRISAFDCIMPNGIPGKGKILNYLTKFWFKKFPEFTNHFVEDGSLPRALKEFEHLITGRSMLVRKADVIPIECVARGYLAGSGWKEYQQSGTVCGIKLPAGLQQCAKLPQSIFTPATKEESGHDVNISIDEMAGRVGWNLALELRDKTHDLYTRAAAYALERGVIIADTKFEFGKLPDGRIILIDEVLTPDSSRFWPAEGYEPGHDQPSFDKQYVRNWLEAQAWDKTPPAPALPDAVVEGTIARYIEAYKLLTGEAPKFLQSA